MKKPEKTVTLPELTKSRVDVEFFKETKAQDPLGVVAALACVSRRTARKHLIKAGALTL
jgi:hypothetical protein